MAGVAGALAIAPVMPTTCVTSFTAASVDLLVDFLDGIQVEFGSKPRRDGVVSFQASIPPHARGMPVIVVPPWAYKVDVARCVWASNSRR